MIADLHSQNLLLLSPVYSECSSGIGQGSGQSRRRGHALFQILAGIESRMRWGCKIRSRGMSSIALSLLESAILFVHAMNARFVFSVILSYTSFALFRCSCRLSELQGYIVYM